MSHPPLLLIGRSLTLVLLLVTSASAQSTIPDTVAKVIQSEAPESLADQLSAVRNLLQVGDTKEARKILDAIGRRPPSTAELIRAHQQFGAAFFLELSLHPRVGRDANRICQLVFDAVEKAAVESRFIDRQIDELRTTRGEAQRLALAELRKSGADGVARLITRIHGSTDAESQRIWRAALDVITRDYPQPVLAALYADDPILES
ncbi:MAG TPA: hypothetical protein VIY86_14875, partial [Pirellulaceae bacterium]